MNIKKRNISDKAVEKLAESLADKPYGSEVESKDANIRTTIVIPSSMHESLEDLAIKNKRMGRELKTVSAIVREAISVYMDKSSH